MPTPQPEGEVAEEVTTEVVLDPRTEVCCLGMVNWESHATTTLL